MIKPFILLVTGISASGKSTVFEALNRDSSLAHVDFHDVDETGVPVAGRGAWRVYRAEAMLFEARQKAKKGISTVLVGIIPPHELIECKTYDTKCNLHFALLDISSEVFDARIKERLKRHHEMQDYPEVYFSNLRLAQELRHQVFNQKNGHIIPAANLSKDVVIKKVKRLISQLSD